MDFAPYQDQSPETTRALSPPPQEGRRSISPAGPVGSPPLSPRGALHSSSNAWDSTGNASSARAFGGNGIQGFGAVDLESDRGGLSEFETSLPIRLDYEACLAYVLLPPAGGVLLLVLEHKSDYVRFHAWQSALVFSSIFILHLILSWSKFISWTLFVLDWILIGYLTFRAYHDADTLDRFEVPFFGRLASRILDDE